MQTDDTQHASTAAEPQPVAEGFNLVMQLEDPRRLPELMKRIQLRQTTINTALQSLDYVHSARFLPLWDVGKLLIITEFDGNFAKNYVMDFAAVLDAEFSLILSYMKDAPRLPVSRYPDDFWDYVDKYSNPPKPIPRPYAAPFLPYPLKTVIDIVGLEDGRGKKAPPPVRASDAPIELQDVQANVLRGYGGTHAVHLFVHFASAAAARSLLGELTSPPDKSDGLRVTPAERGYAGAPDYCLNVGLTYSGLQALQVPWLQRLPPAFCAGAAARDPESSDHHVVAGWRFGNDADAVHAVLSLYTKEARGEQLPAGLVRREAQLRAAVARSGSAVVGDALRAARLPARGNGDDYTDRIHFGYRDGISLQRVEGVHAADNANPGSKAAPAGDFILGGGQLNSRGGNFIGELPAAWADNASYAALRVIRQHVPAFDAFLTQAAETIGMAGEAGRERVAAKLMGRDREHGKALVPGAGIGDDLDAFTYAATDARGHGCPLGAHIRRMNPRDSVVMGVPALRRVLRRGMPYGNPGDDDVGLVGLFYCGDLETQFEFLLKTWALGDLATTGIRGTQDPFVSTRDSEFRLRAEPDAEEKSLTVPPLTQTVGALYLFVPGLRGLARLAGRSDSGVASRAFSLRAPARSFNAGAFSPYDPAFRSDPYRYYKALREDSPVQLVAPYSQYWLVSHAQVDAACNASSVFVKPRSTDEASKPSTLSVQQNFRAGLFFMNGNRHAAVRPVMDQAFAAAIAGIEGYATEQAHRLLDEALPRGSLDVVGDYAAKLPMRVFMRVMGLPDEHWSGVDAWVRSALAGHFLGAPVAKRLEGATVALALRSYFHALGLGCPMKPVGDAALATSIFQAKGAGKKPLMRIDEAMQTALHFALGGYLSTEFLIGSGVYNLLRDPQQWALLRDDRGLMDSAIDEMLRYDAPFQIADRVLASAHEFDGVPDPHDPAKTLKLPAGTEIGLVYGAANHDPAVHGVQADRFDIQRQPQPHFGFGPDGRFCIGRELARQVTRIALDTLLERCPQLQIDRVGDWQPDPYYRSLTSLLVFPGWGNPMS